MSECGGNLLWTEDHLGHNISPGDRDAARDVTVIVSTRYWVDSIHENVPRPDRDYFARRGELFLRYTLPSVLAQVRAPNRWLVLASPWVLELPEMKPVLEALDEVSFAQLLVVPEARAFSSVSRAWIDTFMRTPSHRAHWLATVRLDNDDALSCDYVDAISKWVTLAKPASPSTVVFPIGIQVGNQLRNQVRVQAEADRQGERDARLFVSMVNHFTAAVSRPGESGVFDPYLVNHTEIYRRPVLQTEQVYQLSTRFPMWLEVLHGDNAANHYRPGPALAPGWEARFGLHHDRRPDRRPDSHCDESEEGS